MTESVRLESIREALLETVARLELGRYDEEGPRRNVIHLESWAAWNTAVNEMTKLGYVLVTPAEYATIYAIPAEEVDRMIRTEGNLFALLYISGPVVHCAVPLRLMDRPQCYPRDLPLERR